MQRRLHASLPEIRQPVGKGIANNLGEQLFSVFLSNASLYRKWSGEQIIK
jgi:hypothetical protein